MVRIELNHWFANKDGLSISLLRFYADIEIQSEDNNINYLLTIYDSDRKTLSLSFSSLEDAISFTEDTVLKATELSVIAEEYHNRMQHEQLRIPGVNVTKDGKVTLTEAEVCEAIVQYYGHNRKDSLSAHKEMSLSGDNIDLRFYLVENDRNILLTEGDLRNVFQHYLNPCDLELDDFKYIGHIRRVGYFVDEDTPVFQGIQLQTHSKKKEYKKDNR